MIKHAVENMGRHVRKYLEVLIGSVYWEVHRFLKIMANKTDKSSDLKEGIYFLA